jgi:hypothetical protein
MRNLALTGELVKAIRLFQEAGIPVLTFKGPVLAMQLYQELGLRQFADVDILVPQTYLTRAKLCLAEAGFKPDHQLDVSQEAALTHFLHELGFRSTAGYKVELHWRLFERYFSLWPSSGVFERARAVRLFNLEIKTFANEDLLLYLCVHGTKHMWSQLSFVVDIAKLVCTQDLDWDEVFRRSRWQGSERMLLLGLGLVRRVLGVTLPNEVLAPASHNALITKLASWFEQCLQDDRLVSVFEGYIFQLRVRERLSDKCRYGLLSLLAPTPHDWAFLRLPRVFFPLYYFVRPIRLLVRYGQTLPRKPQDAPKDPAA